MVVWVMGTTLAEAATDPDDDPAPPPTVETKDTAITRWIQRQIDRPQTRQLEERLGDRTLWVGGGGPVIIIPAVGAVMPYMWGAEIRGEGANGASRVITGRALNLGPATVMKRDLDATDDPRAFEPHPDDSFLDRVSKGLGRKGMGIGVSGYPLVPFSYQRPNVITQKDMVNFVLRGVANLGVGHEVWGGQGYATLAMLAKLIPGSQFVTSLPVVEWFIPPKVIDGWNTFIPQAGGTVLFYMHSPGFGPSEQWVADKGDLVRRASKPIAAAFEGAFKYTARPIINGAAWSIRRAMRRDGQGRR